MGDDRQGISDVDTSRSPDVARNTASPGRDFDSSLSPERMDFSGSRATSVEGSPRPDEDELLNTQRPSTGSSKGLSRLFDLPDKDELLTPQSPREQIIHARAAEHE